jgi:hypothetical protein
VEDLEHEATVYHRLQLAQGVYVPVFLGAVDLCDLRRVYYYMYVIIAPKIGSQRERELLRHGPALRFTMKFYEKLLNLLFFRNIIESIVLKF